MRSIKNCSVCVTGGAGFLGSHLVDHLLNDRKCQVLVIDNLCVGRREFVHKDAIFHHHDLTGSEEHTRNLFKEYKVKYVFSYFSMPYIPDSFARPLRVCDVNFMGAIRVINAAQEAGAEAILQVSSAEIYGDAGETARLKLEKMGMSPESIKEVGLRIDESAQVVPHSSYGASKAAVDAYCQVAWKERKCPVIALRQFNCCGPRKETHPYVIPEIIGQLSKFGTRPKYDGAQTVNDYKDPVTILLGNNSSRDFLYAGDQARIATELLERGQLGDVYNLGSESSIKIYDLAKLIGKLMGFKEVKIVEDETRKRPWEIWSLQSCNDKLQAATNYQRNTLTPLEAALQKTINWFNKNGRKWAWER